MRQGERKLAGQCEAIGVGAAFRRPCLVRLQPDHRSPNDPITLTRLPRAASREYVGGMRMKTSVTLSEDILKTVDRAARKGESRSRAIERLLRDSLAAQARRAADERDLALINHHADGLNAEAEDVLSYQVDL